MAPKKENSPDPIRVLVREHGEKLDQYGKKMDEMYFAIMGNKDAEIEGLAQKVKNHGVYIAKDKKFKWMVGAGLFGMNGGLIAYLKAHLGL